MDVTSAAAINSYMQWWSNAGYDVPANDGPCNWLADQRGSAGSTPVAVARSESPSQSDDAPQPIAHPKQDGLADALAAIPDLASFDLWLHQAALPGRAWSDRIVLPTGSGNASLMILADVPDLEDIEAGALFSGEAGRLLDAMLAAIDLTRENCRIGSIAFTRPIGGQLDDAHKGLLKAIAQRHIALANPAKLLLLGQQSCLIMTGQPIPPDGKGQREINHCGAMTAAFAAHHPRLLIARPQLKRPAWEALKRLKEIV